MPRMEAKVRHLSGACRLGLSRPVKEPRQLGLRIGRGLAWEKAAGLTNSRPALQQLQGRPPQKAAATKTKRPVSESSEPAFAFEFDPGGELRSHTVARAVSSAQRGLTSVFAMGTGVTPTI